MADGGRRIFVMGHPEYDRVTLDGEYKRDVSKNLPIEIPKNYYKDNDPANMTTSYVESPCKQSVYKLAELLRIPEYPIRPVWNTGF